LFIPTPSGGGDMTLWIAVGIVAVIVVFAVAFFAIRARKA
jgi:hypothetical protein